MLRPSPGGTGEAERESWRAAAARRRVFAAALLALGAMAQSPGARAEGGDAKRGRALAQEWCARCHAISAEQERPGETDVPPFRRIAADQRWTREALIRMITVPHINMPPPVLTRDEAEHVAAYILSLRN